MSSPSTPKVSPPAPVPELKGGEVREKAPGDEDQPLKRTSRQLLRRNRSAQAPAANPAGVAL